MGNLFSKSSSTIETSIEIQELAQLTGITGEVIFSHSGYTQLVEKIVVWKVENFVIDIEGKDYWEHSLPFKMGKDDGNLLASSSWTFNLSCKSVKIEENHDGTYDDREIFECSPKFKGRRKSAKDLFYSLKATIHGSRKKESYQSPVRGIEETCEIFKMRKGSLVESHLSESGSLILQLTLKVFRAKTPVVITKQNIPVSSPLKDNSSSKASYGQFLISKQFCDAKIYSSDGKKFDAHKVILSGESEVFNVMFKSGMTEATTGVVKLHDMSSTAVHFLLSFMYDGNILPFTVNGKKVEGLFRNPRNGLDTSEKNLLKANEVLYVASKYKLSGILDHVDRTFRQVCCEENAADLLELTKMHNLDCKEFLKDFVKRHPRAIDDLMEQ